MAYSSLLLSHILSADEQRVTSPDMSLDALWSCHISPSHSLARLLPFPCRKQAGLGVGGEDYQTSKYESYHWFLEDICYKQFPVCPAGLSNHSHFGMGMVGSSLSPKEGCKTHLGKQYLYGPRFHLQHNTLLSKDGKRKDRGFG